MFVTATEPPAEGRKYKAATITNWAEVEEENNKGFFFFQWFLNPKERNVGLKLNPRGERKLWVVLDWREGGPEGLIRNNFCIIFKHFTVTPLFLCLFLSFFQTEKIT